MACIVQSTIWAWAKLPIVTPQKQKFPESDKMSSQQSRTSAQQQRMRRGFLPMKSCQLPIAAVAAQEITTIEGLSESGEHPVQKAWLSLDVAQCGYCQTGQIMAASALLKSKPHPTDEEIETAMNGNICRCGTYVRIKQAIQSAAKNAHQ